MVKKTSKKKKTTGNFKNLSSFMGTPSKEKTAIPKQTKTKIPSQKSKPTEDKAINDMNKIKSKTHIKSKTQKKKTPAIKKTEEPKTNKEIENKDHPVTKKGQEKDIKANIKQKLEKKVEQKLEQKVEQEETTNSIKVEENIEKSDYKKIFYPTNSTPIGDSKYPNIPKRKNRESQKSWHLRILDQNAQIVQDMKHGVLLSVEYDGDYNKAFIKFYDLSDDTIKIWIDTTNHRPYCYSKLSESELANFEPLLDHEGYDGMETVQRYDLLEDKLLDLTKIYGITPTDIGGANGIRSVLKDFGGTWESNIRYHHNFIYDRDLIPGMSYKIQAGSLTPLPPKINSKMEKQLMNVFKDAPAEIKDMAKQYHPIFSTPSPQMKRLAFDIEVSETDDGGVPDPMLAKYQVISVSFVATDGLKLVYCLDRDKPDLGTLPKEFPEDGKIYFFNNEKELLQETFRLIWDYPIIITFNGDNFDNTYLYHRAQKLKIDPLINPIYTMRGGGMVSHYTFYKHSIHFDIFQFFANRSIKGYAFGGAYLRNSLNEISKNLLDMGKIKHEGIAIGKMKLLDLIYYNLVDSLLTLDLTEFNNSLVWNLVIILMRITRLPFQDLHRLQISAWIKSLMYSVHRQKNNLLPRMSELEARGKFSRNKTEKFQGAYVIPPVPGIHFNVAVLDFSSLYPSIIKTQNLSYETVLCNHPKCKDNLLPNTKNWACTKRMGIFAYTVGYLRDVRVKWFKPLSNRTDISKSEKQMASVMASALKVFINGCLPYDEEVIIRNKKNKILKIKIGDLSKIWQNVEILSVNNKKDKFGEKVFVPINGFTKRNANIILEITLSDGRKIKCTPEHIIPKVDYEQNFVEIEANKLKIGDNILVYHRNLLNKKQINSLFIPDIIDNNNLWIAIEREEYKKHSYKRNQKSDDKTISIINSKFKYSKTSKIYKFLWNKLTLDEKKIIKDSIYNKYYRFLLKYGEEAGRWRNIIFELKPKFFELLGWYMAEGSSDKNRISISQSKKIHLENWNNIIQIIESLGYPYSKSNNKNIRINSNIVKEIIITLCSKIADNKKIPLEILNKKRAELLINSYFKGDGNLTKNKWRRYSTKSEQLKNDLVYILGALGKYVSIHKPSKIDNVFRIIETEGKKYKRKNYGLLDFHGTTPVRIKGIKQITGKIDVFDIETGNGWFISTNGIIVHNCYGVFGSPIFPLYFRPVAESTTAIARYSIKQTIEKSESLGVKVLYGDTDSVFLAHPTKNQVSEIVKWSEKELDLNLELEKTYQFLALSGRKKNYIGVRKGGKHVDLKGLLAKKHNTPDFIKIKFAEVQNILTQITDMDSFKKDRNKIISIIRQTNRIIGKPESQGGFPIKEYGISVFIKKNLDSYDKTIPQHVKAAKMDKNQKYHSGSFITYVKTRNKEGVKPLNMASLPDLDIPKYKEMVQSTFEQVLDALGIDYEEIRGAKKLSSFFS